MKKITVEMTEREYKKFQAYRKADKIARSIRRGLKEAEEARNGQRILKPAHDLAYEL